MRRSFLLAIAMFASCNLNDTFRLTGYAQQGFTTRADILFVVDNSPSMYDKSTALAQNFSSFIEAFATPPPSQEPSLSDQLGRYLDHLQDRTKNLNYHIGITTTAVNTDVGKLLGHPQVITPENPNPARAFNNTLVCDAACVDGDPGVQVDCPVPSAQSSCADGRDATEEHLEAVYLALCGAVPNPPGDCLKRWWYPATESHASPHPPGIDTGLSEVDSSTPPQDYFNEDRILQNDGWLRDGSVIIPVIVTDEGDTSRRLTEKTADITAYLDRFAAFGHRMAFAVIGPNLTPGCNAAGANDWGTNRLKAVVSSTNGAYIPINQPDKDGRCSTVDFAEALTRVGSLLRGLANTFPLNSTPVVDSIVVLVDDKAIEASECSFDETLNQMVCEDGWSYEPRDNTIVLHGDAIPDFDADVRVYYLPEAGSPRGLPF